MSLGEVTGTTLLDTKANILASIAQGTVLCQREKG